jgi:hypothetical protein
MTSAPPTNTTALAVAPGPPIPILMPEASQAPCTVQLAYFDVWSPQPGCFVAGLLVVDAAGLPLAFHYTEPLKPTKLQHILYGESLAPYVRRALLLEPLLAQVTLPYALLLLQDERLLGESWTLDKPYLRLKTTQVPPLAQAFSYRPATPTEALLQLHDQQPPLRVSGLPEVPATEWATVLTPLAQVGLSLNLAEPFDRITQALMQVGAG